MYENPQNAGSTRDGRKTFCGKNEDLGGRGSKVTFVVLAGILIFQNFGYLNYKNGLI